MRITMNTDPIVVDRYIELKSSKMIEATGFIARKANPKGHCPNFFCSIVIRLEGVNRSVLRDALRRAIEFLNKNDFATEKEIENDTRPKD